MDWGKHSVQLTSKGKKQAVLGAVMLDLKLLNDSGHVMLNKTESYPKLMLQVAHLFCGAPWLLLDEFCKCAPAESVR